MIAGHGRHILGRQSNDAETHSTIRGPFQQQVMLGGGLMVVVS